VDLENIVLVGNTIAALLQKSYAPLWEEKECKMQLTRERTKMGLIITHTGFILDYVTADMGQVLFDGELSCVNNPREIFKQIGQSGYKECVKCIAARS
jgi:Fe-S cluster assembly ATP-binding protein